MVNCPIDRYPTKTEILCVLVGVTNRTPGDYVLTSSSCEFDDPSDAEAFAAALEVLFPGYGVERQGSTVTFTTAERA